MSVLPLTATYVLVNSKGVTVLTRQPLNATYAAGDACAWDLYLGIVGRGFLLTYGPGMFPTHPHRALGIMARTSVRGDNLLCT